MEVPSSLRIP